MNTLFETTEATEEKTFEQDVRPQIFEQFIGQNEVKKSLALYVKAAVQRGSVLDHVLFYGAPGLGKTTLAGIVANEIGTQFHVTSGAIISKPADLVSTLMSLNEGDVLFIDEIHRLPKSVEEFLYPAMEDFVVDMVTDEKDKAKSTVRVPISKFTLIGATTRAGMISAPLRDRFGIDYHMEFYNHRDLGYITTRTSKILGSEIEKDAVAYIASGARGTPRIVNRIIRRCRDVADIEGNGTITREVAEQTFTMLRIDESGLDALDRKVLRSIIENHDGGPVGIKTIGVTVGEDEETIETMHEPFLIQSGLLERTSRGRCATRKAYKHLGYKLEN